ncbi:unnamed protein product [Effrenium voratum]|uniref:C3H1-type domain-containing protein n=1 Tax=Effrenium voratum TaxID=2562239 RepID=A0AA36J7A1_9DINO|nr:unnamed protein product [Effrenium voratum]
MELRHQGFVRGFARGFALAMLDKLANSNAASTATAGRPVKEGGAFSAEMGQLHLEKRCRPCVAFALKPEGCWKGDSCSYCHFCSREEAKSRRQQLQLEARSSRRANLRAKPSEANANLGVQEIRFAGSGLTTSFWL